jgi:YhcH/YjgK/YiaL family protein
MISFIGIKTSIIIISIMAIMTTACNHQKKTDPAGWTAEKLSEWFINGKWKQGWNVVPDELTDQREFAVQFHKNPERWEKAFSFLNETDLTALEPGRYELSGNDLFVNVDEYISKHEEDALYEAHKKYADIQYVVSGEEKIGVMPLEETTDTIPYNEEKDIVFLRAAGNNYRLANTEKFFLFFPGDAHRPCVRTDKPEPIKKVVIKVRLND